MKAIACALLVGAFLLSSCQGEAAEPKPSPQTTAPANPDATLPPMPAGANEFTPSGASTFVRHYVEVMEYSAQTGDVTELKRLSFEDCEGCNRYIDVFVGMYAKGGYSKPRDWSVGGINLLFNKHEGYESTARTSLKLTAGTIKSSSEATEHTYPKTSGKVILGLVFDDGWRMSQIAGKE